MKDLEIEKDALWCGMEILEKARLWYIQRLQENRAQQENTAQRERIVGKSGKRAAQVHSCLLRSRIQRVNGSLGAVMSDPNGISIRKPNLSEAEADSDLRWQNSVLTQQVSDKNRRISSLELDKDVLLNQLRLLLNR
ncbi:suppressor APC domain-containing protein 1 isoform X2 [Gouania willdenowi]|nr:suppressor APC domain-containing protein 1 isoform X2 [Gouania willdenowi]